MTTTRAEVGPEPRLRVLVVDDSVVVRQVVARIVEHEESMELAGVAANGRIALEKMSRTGADVVLLDLDMPEMDGFETLTAIRQSHPTLPVIIFSHLTEIGAAATLDALALGATDFALKPSADSLLGAEVHLRDQLVPLLLGVRPHAAPSATPRIGSRSLPVRPSAVSVVVVAVSTGGPNALADIVPALPADLRVPVLVVQHMPALFTTLLAERLDRLAALTVVEASAGEPVLPGRVYIAPGGRHLSLTGTSHDHDVRVELTDAPPENSCRPSADVLFRAAAAAYGSGTLALVLTGMGRDGLRGSEVVRASGGHVLAQTEASAVVASMPAAVAAAGLADDLVPLERVASELFRRTTGSAVPT